MPKHRHRPRQNRSYQISGETKAALDAYDEPLMRETLSLLKQAVEGGQISVIEYFVEAANIYTNLSNCITLQNRYQKLLAQLYINRL